MGNPPNAWKQIPGECRVGGAGSSATVFSLLGENVLPAQLVTCHCALAACAEHSVLQSLSDVQNILNKNKGSFRSTIRKFFWCWVMSHWKRCFWSGTSEPHYVLLPCDRWQQRGTLTKWRLTWECVWSKGMELDSSIWNDGHPLMVINACWTLMEIKQWMWVCEAVSGVFQKRWKRCERQATFWTAVLMQVLVHCWWICIANGSDWVEK